MSGTLEFIAKRLMANDVDLLGLDKAPVGTLMVDDCGRSDREMRNGSGREIRATHESISCHPIALSASEPPHLALTLVAEQFIAARGGRYIAARGRARALFQRPRQRLSRMPKSFPQDRTKVATADKHRSAGSILSAAITPRGRSG